MRRPGIIGSMHTPKKRSNYAGLVGLAGFGKGAFVPPPAAPPAPIPANWMGNKWDCSNQPKPPNDAAHYHHCCPGGWTKTRFEETNPCAADGGKYSCGPLPENAIVENMECHDGQWSDITDPNSILHSATTPQDILAPAIEFDRAPLLRPGMIPLIGGGVALLFIVTIVMKMRK